MNEPTAPSHLLALMTAVAIADTAPADGDAEKAAYRFTNGHLRALLAERTEVEALLRALFQADDDYGCGFYDYEPWLKAYDALRAKLGFRSAYGTDPLPRPPEPV